MTATKPHYQQVCKAQHTSPTSVSQAGTAFKSTQRAPAHKRRTRRLDPLQLLTLVVTGVTADETRLGKNIELNGDEGIGIRAGSKFLCTLCTSTFGRRCELKRHIGEVHTTNGARRFRCTHPSCGKSFTRKDAVVKHYAVKHQGKRRFICPTCSERFTSRYDLSRHTVRVHSSVKKRFTCEYCKAGFSQKSQLTMHKGRVHVTNASTSQHTPAETSAISTLAMSSDTASQSHSHNFTEKSMFRDCPSPIDSLATVAAALADERDSMSIGSGIYCHSVDVNAPTHYQECDGYNRKTKIEPASCGMHTLLTAAAVLQPSLGHDLGQDKNDVTENATRHNAQKYFV